MASLGMHNLIDDGDDNMIQLNEVDQYLSSPVEKALSASAAKSKSPSKDVMKFWI